MIIGIFFKSQPNAKGYLHATDRFRPYPYQLREAAQSLGHEFVLLCRNESYDGDGYFSDYWEINESPVGTYTHVQQKIKPDAVIDKGFLSANDGAVPVISPLNFMRFAENKYSQLGVYKDLLAPTTYVESVDELRKAFDTFTGRRVLKPLDQNGGKGIVITDSWDEIDVKTLQFPLIIQQFVDSSNGYKDLVDGMHDIRIYMFGSEPQIMSVRTPPEGSLLSNTKKGGTINFYDKSEITGELRDYVAKVNAMLPFDGPRVWSVDVMYADDKLYLVELAGRPGIPIQSQAPFISDFHRNLMSYVASSVAAKKSS